MYNYGQLRKHVQRRSEAPARMRKSCLCAAQPSVVRSSLTCYTRTYVYYEQYEPHPHANMY